MKLVRIIAGAGFYLTRILAVLYFITDLHLLSSVAFKLSTFERLENGRFVITYPFSHSRFLLGSVYSPAYVAEMASIILFYGVFFWLLGNVFKTFRQKKLFTMAGIKTLKFFYLFNLLFCPVLFLILRTFSIEDYPYIAMMIAHAIMGIFALFIAAIFTQGVNIQQDQDLFI